MRNFITAEVPFLISQGNPGALRVLTELIGVTSAEEFYLAVEKLAENKILGPDLWVLYKDDNNCDIEKVKEHILKL